MLPYYTSRGWEPRTADVIISRRAAGILSGDLPLAFLKLHASTPDR
jgi:hypothetical protein